MARELDGLFPLTPQQEGILFESLAAPESGLHVEQHAFDWLGSLDLARLLQAWDAVVQRYGVLRTAFVWRNRDQPLQAVVAKIKTPTGWVDLRGLAVAQADDLWSSILDQERLRPFRMAKPPLVRLLLGLMPDGRVGIALTFHHILLDGWSLSLVMQAWLNAYLGLASDVSLGKALGSPPPGFDQYVRWVREQEDAVAASFWRDTLEGVTLPQCLGPGWDGNRRAGESKRRGREMSVSTTRAAQSLASEARVTLNTLIQAAWAVLLSAWSERDDVVFGTTVSGRAAPLNAVSEMVGLFISTLPFRVAVRQDMALGDWLREIAEAHRAIRQYEYVGPGQIQSWLSLDGRMSLYESLLVFENYPFDGAADDLATVGASLQLRETDGAHTHHALTMLVAPSEPLEMAIVYDAGRLNETYVDTVLARLERVLEAMVQAGPDALVRACLAETPPAPSAVAEGPAQRAVLAPKQAPAGELSRRLLAIWRASFDRDDFGVEAHFFELGGHSLQAARLAASMSEAFGVRIPLGVLFANPTITAMAEYLRSSEPTSADVALKAEPDEGARFEPFPLTDVQYAYWIGRRAMFGEAATSTHGYLEVDCPRLDVNRLNDAWNKVLARHDMLRAVVDEDGFQRILHQTPTYKIDEDEPADAPALARRTRTLRERLSHQVFDPAVWPLFEVAVTHLDVTHSRLHLSFDLLIADAASFWLMCEEWTRWYEDPSWRPEPLKLSFRDFVMAEQRLRDGRRYEQDRAYWLERLSGLPSAPELPLAERPENLESVRFKRREARVEMARWARLKRRARRRRISPSALLLAVYATTLATWARRSRFCLNVTTFNRRPVHEEVDSLVGDFTSVLVLEAAVEACFAQTAAGLQERLWSDLGHDTFSGVAVMRELARRQGRREGPLMPVVFTSVLEQSAAASSESGRLLDGDVAYAIGQTSQVWLDHQVQEDDGVLVYVWDSVVGLLDEHMMDAMFNVALDLLRFLADEDESVWDAALPSLTPTDQVACLEAANRTQAALTTTMLDAPFWAQARTHPERLAVMTADRQITYHQLAGMAGRLAHQLLELGLGREQPVAVMMVKGWAQVVAVLGVLRVGAYYVPVDRGLPAARREVLLRESGALAVVTDRPDPDAFLPTLLVDERALNWCVAPPPALPELLDALAYVIFTSGSTGVPKGVATSHRGASNTIVDINSRFEVGHQDRVLAVSSLSFDLSVYDIFGLLAVGGAVIMPDAEHTVDPDHWLLLIRRCEPTLWNSVPALMRMLTDALAGREEHLALSLVMMSGDWIPLDLPDAVRVVAPDAEIVSLGGATEAAIWSILYPIDQVRPEWRSVPYGLPMANQSFFVLHEDLRRCPLGAEGELFIGGIGAARCYARDPQKTAWRFIPNPFAKTEAIADLRLYRTGDVGRYMPDGRIEFMGRVDRQLKLRGFRIEPGEVETALVGHEGVRHALVVVRDAQLVAYAVPEEGMATLETEVLAWAGEALPAYMTPQFLIWLETFPLTANGKVDVKALPAPVADQEAFVECQTETETMIAELWRELLGATRVLGGAADFFELGGDSLVANRVVLRLRERLGIEVPLRLIFAYPMLKDFSAALDERVDARETVTVQPQTHSEMRVARMSFAQERLWFLDRLNPNAAVFNMPAPMRLRGALNVTLLKRCFEALIERHEALRTRFAERHPTSGGEFPVQIVESATTPALVLEKTTVEALPERLLEVARQPFDLARGPLLRLHLFELDARDHVLLINMHHIITDGWSLSLLLREFAQGYVSGYQGLEPSWPLLELRYLDVARAQRARDDEASLAFWREHLHDAPAVSTFPEDRVRPNPQSFSGRLFAFDLDTEAMNRLAGLCREENATLFMGGLSCFALLLSRYALMRDLVVGTVVANRQVAGSEHLLGFFANTLAMRLSVDEQRDFRQLIRQVRDLSLEVFAHEALSFERVVEVLEPERDPSRAPLFQTVFTLENLGVNRLKAIDLPELSLAWEALDVGISKYDLSLHVNAMDQGYVGLIEYNVDLYEEDTIARIAEHFQHLTALCSRESDQPLRTVSMLSDVELQQLADWRGVIRDIEPTPVHLRILQQDRERPALSIEGETWSYDRLIQRAGVVTAALRARGLTLEARVVIDLPRGPEQIAAQIGVLGAGGVFVPLSGDEPPVRRRIIIEDVDPVLVIQARGEDSQQVLGLDELTGQADLNWVRTPIEQMAYVMFTSGSTGKPKGVMISHRAVLSLIDENPVVVGERVLHAASPAFDAATFELWAPLASGGCVVILDAERDASERLPALLRQNQIDNAFLTSALFNLLIDQEPDCFAQMGRLIVGGEANSADHFQRCVDAYPNLDLWAIYGPTEVTTYTTGYAARDEPLHALGVPIGHVLINRSAYVLDHELRLTPVGVTGDLYLGGPGLARGYWRKSTLTATSFVPHPSGESGERLYRTGDRARWLPDGRLLFDGRRDGQIKLRGHRIELGEITNRLLAYETVNEAVVRLFEGGRLIAFVAPVSDTKIDLDQLRKDLTAALPPYMMPSSFVVLDHLPRNDRDKIDITRLEPPTEAARVDDEPLTDTEEVLARIWARLLNRPAIGAQDHFFELGGHSLLAMRAMARVREVFGFDAPLRALFEQPCLADFAVFVDEHRGGHAPLPRPKPRGQDTQPLSFAQERLWFLDQLAPGAAAYNQPMAVTVNGDLDVGKLKTTLDRIVARHQSLRTVFPTVEGRPEALVLAQLELTPVIIECGDHCDALMREEAMHPFDLAKGPLIRVCVFQSQVTRLLVVVHHIVSDGLSLQNLLRELQLLYDEQTPVELSLQYGDYAQWRREQVQGELLARQLAFWVEHLTGVPPLLTLPTDFPRPIERRYSGGVIRFKAPEATTEALQAFCTRTETTPFQVLLTVFAVLLARTADQEDLCIGVPVANRPDEQLEPLIGIFVNTLTFRFQTGDDPDFLTLVRRTRDFALSAYANGDAPFEQVVERLAPQRDLNSTPLFQCLFTLVATEPEPDVEGVQFKATPFDYGLAAFDLTLNMVVEQGRLSGALNYAAELFEPETAERMVAHLVTLLTALLMNPETTVHRVRLMDDEERLTLLTEWHGPKRAIEESVPTRFLTQAARTPQAFAVAGRDQEMTYAELAERASRLATALRARKCGMEVAVGVCGQGSAELFVTAMGVMIAGAVLVLIDPVYPRARRKAMCDDGRLALILTCEGAPEDWDDGGPSHLRAAELIRETKSQTWSKPLDLQIAYLVFTSGSTGRPKGVAVSHMALANLITDNADVCDLQAGDRVPHLGALGFDVTLGQILTALCVGATLVLPPEDFQPSHEAFIRWIERDDWNVMIAATAFWTQWARDLREEDRIPSSLRAMTLCGEQPNLGLLERWREAGGVAMRWSNLYGPAEATIMITTYRVQGHLPQARVPMGAPIANSSVMLLDRTGEPVPQGVVGEFYLGGVQIARGYVGRARLTAERFLPDPCGGMGVRRYRTGDLGRYVGGETGFEFLGRADRQLKVLGRRVEPDEIATVLIHHPDIADAVVNLDADGARLWAWLTLATTRLDEALLREYLSEHLPGYMIPSGFVVVEQLPRTPNGKIDLNALPAPEGRLLDREGEYTPPQNEIQRAIAHLWRELLGRGRIGIHDHFFEIGGNSFLVTRFLARLEREQGLRLPVRVLFQHATIAELAAYIEFVAAAGRPPIESGDDMEEGEI